jgi:hypothetical protein
VSLHLAFAFIAAVGYLVVPGYALLGVLRFDAWIRLVFAPAATAALVAVLGIVYAAVHLRFEPATVIPVVLALAVVAVVRRDRTHVRSFDLAAALGGGLLLSVGLWFVEFVHHLSGSGSFVKNYDAPWHFSIIRHMVETGNASTLTAGLVDPTVGSGFYPASWHAVVALVLESVPASLPQAVNGTVYAILAVAWPLSMVALTTLVVRRSAAVVVSTCVLAAAFVAFPLHFTVYGILYANMYGFAVLPALIAAILLLRRDDLGLRERIALLAITGLGAAIAQPNSVFTACLILGGFGLGWFHHEVAQRRDRRTATGASVVLVGVLGLLWGLIELTPFMSRTVHVDWPPFAGTGRVLRDVVIGSFNGARPSYVAGAVVLVGLVVAWRRARWLVVGHLTVGLAYVVTGSFWFQEHARFFRIGMTGYWYHDDNRLAAATVMTSVPLAVLAVDAVGSWVAHRLAGRLDRRVLAGAVVAALACVVTVGSMAGAGIRKEEANLTLQTSLFPAGTQPSFVLNEAKAHFLRRVSEYLPPGTSVANNPYDGSSFGFGIYGIDTYFKSYDGNWMGTPSRDQNAIRSHLVSLGADRGLCSVLDRLGIRYVLQMPHTGINHRGPRVPTIDYPKRHWLGLGLTPTTPGFRLVLTGGPGMRLYRITACGDSRL